MLAEQDLTPLVPLSIPPFDRLRVVSEVEPPKVGERGISKIRRTGGEVKSCKGRIHSTQKKAIK
jgi:hypothetical protein